MTGNEKLRRKQNESVPEPQKQQVCVIALGHDEKARVDPQRQTTTVLCPGILLNRYALL